MSEQLKHQLQGNSSILFGVLLIGLGSLFLLGQWFHLDIGPWGWPFFLVIMGLAVLAVGISSREQTNQRLIVVGTVTAAVGFLLFYQNLTAHWSSWAYAWGLVAPAAVGVGKMIYGTIKDERAAVTEGMRLAGIGLIIFLAGLIFFEVGIGIGGFGLGSWSWPFLLIIIGFVLLMRTLREDAQKG